MIILSFIPSLIVLYTSCVIVGLVVSQICHGLSFIFMLLCDTLYLIPACTLEGAELLLADRVPERIVKVSITDMIARHFNHSKKFTIDLETILTAPQIQSMVDAIDVHHHMLYIRITYTTLMITTYSLMGGNVHIEWPKRSRYCCFLRCSRLSDQIDFPPYLPFDRSVYYPRFHRAVLLLQYKEEGRLKRQYSCVVTDAIQMLAGPRQDFFTSTPLGNHLDPTIVFLLLEGHITQLLEQFKKNTVFYRITPLQMGLPNKVNRDVRRELQLKLRCDMKHSGKRFILDLNSYLPL